MNYIAYKLAFKTGVHFGNNSLSDGEAIFHADSLFSALCIEAVKNSEDELNKMHSLFSNGSLSISDAFPFVENTLFIPKPCCYIERKEDKNTGSSEEKKRQKKLKYISIDNFDKYFTSTLDTTAELEKIKNLGSFSLKTSVEVSRTEEPTPFEIGVYTFNENCGLYVIVGYDSKDNLEWLYKYFKGLSYVGIGGKKSAGLGKFTLKPKKLPDEFIGRLSADSNKYMLLSVALPTADEMNTAVKNAEYSLIKRSGFISSSTYSNTFERKKDIYVFDAGSCFTNKFSGDIYDVSSKGNHPVYKYAKPMWLGVWLWVKIKKIIKSF